MESAYPYDRGFQDSLLTLMAKEPTFLPSYSEVIRPEYFHDEAPSILARILLDSFSEAGVVPRAAVVKRDVVDYLGKVKLDAPVRRELETLANSVYDANLSDIPEDVTRRTVEFGKHRLLQAVTIQAGEMLSGGAPSDEIWEMLDGFRQHGSTGGTEIVDLGAKLRDGVNLVRASSIYAAHAKVSTGFPTLDRMMNGGIGRRQLMAVMGFTNMGKCVRRGTLVVKFSGEVVKVEDVEVGDQLMGMDSTPREVLALLNGVGRMYKVIPNKGDPWYCNDDHVLTLVNNHKKWTVAGIPPGDVGDVHIQEYLGLTATQKHVLKQFQVEGGVVFPPMEIGPMRVSPYFLGVWLGDGTKALDGVAVTKADAEIEHACRLEAEKFSLRVRTCISEKTLCPTYHLVGQQGVNNPLLDELRILMSGGVRIPPQYLRGSRSVRLQVLAGLLDTDGHLLGNGGFEFTQKNTLISEDIQFLARSLGFRVTRSRKEVKGVAYERLRILGPVDDIPTRVPRKKSKHGTKKRNSLRTGFRVEVVEDDEFFGFELDRDHRFLLGDFTVTHNSMFLVNLGVSALKQRLPVVHISVGEMEEEDMLARYGARLTGIDINDIAGDADIQGEYDAKIEEIFGMLEPQILFKYVPPYTPVSTVRGILSRIKYKEGIDPVVVLIDNADELSSSKRSEEKYDEQGYVYTDLKSVAHDFDVAMMVDTQTNRFGGKAYIAGMDVMGESHRKSKKLDGLFSLNQSQEEQLTSILRIHAVKGRRFRRSIDDVCYCFVDKDRMNMREVSSNDPRVTKVRDMLSKKAA